MRIVLAVAAGILAGCLVAVGLYDLGAERAPGAAAVASQPEAASTPDPEPRSTFVRASGGELDWNAVLNNVGFSAYASDQYTPGVPFELAISGARRWVNLTISVRFAEVPKVGVEYSLASPEVSGVEAGAWKVVKPGSETEPAEWISYHSVSELKVRFRALPERADGSGTLWTPHGRMDLRLSSPGEPDLAMVVDF